MTTQTIENQQISSSLQTWLEIFIVDRKAQDLSPAMIKFYDYNLQIFIKWRGDESVIYLDQLNQNRIK